MLPKPSAEKSLAQSSYTFTTASLETPANPGVDMALSVSCLLKCGVSALGCLHCGTNIGCWASCAGPDAVGCITGCL